MFVTVISTKYPADSYLTEHYIGRLKKHYPFLAVESIGKSVMDRDILCVRLGYGPRRVFICGAHHGLEWITSLLLLRFIEDYCDKKTRGKSIYGMNICEAFSSVSAYIVPMVNPDGVDIAINGISEKHGRFESIKSMLAGRNEKDVWQANARGVDLNHNYNAGFDIGKSLEASYGIDGPGPTRFGGPYYESEPETRAICRLLRSRHCDLALSYHTQGREIYTGRREELPLGAREYLDIFCEASGYCASSAEGIASYRGFTDWFVEEFNRPAFTIEAGFGKNPLPINAFDGIYLENRRLLASALCTEIL